ncbi:MAG: PQQ-binding-like beta-propeller repeat protein [Protaetiibacter sp.]
MTTTTDQSAPSRPGTTAQRIVAALVVVGLVLAGSASLAAAELTTAPLGGGRAERFVPEDGQLAIVHHSDGTVEVSESARVTGPGMLLEVPAVPGSHQLEQYEGDAALRLQLWRETLTSPDPAVPQTQTVYRLGPDGVALLTVTGGQAGFTFSPPLIVLPAGARGGISWTGEGDALPQGLLLYHSSGSVAAAATGCLLVSMSVDYIDPDSGETLLATADDSTWCQGRGIVHSVGDVSGTPVDYTAEPLPLGAAIPAELRGTPDTGDAVRDWSDAASWADRELSFVIADPMFGDGPVGSPNDGTGAATASGVLALAAGGELLGYTREGPTATRAFVARPGGGIVRVTAIGEVLLVATTLRQLVAYDDRGMRLWARAYADLVLAPPVSDGAGGAIVVALDGTVARLDLATGAERWSTELRTDAAAAPVVAGGVVAVLDRGPTVHALALADGHERWAASVATPSTLASDGTGIAVVGETGDLTVLESSDGEVRWADAVDGVTRAALVVDGVLVVASDESSTGWELATGSRLWSDPAAIALASDGTRVVLLSDTAVAVRESASGEQLSRVEIGVAGIGTTRQLVPFADSVWVVTSATGGVEVGP